MKSLYKSLETVHNIGLLDRFVRLLFAAVLIIVPATMHGEMTTWQAFFMVLAVYPAITGFLGWDPYYQMTHVKSCGFSDRNQCGTLPFEIEAALGHHPKPKDEHDH